MQELISDLSWNAMEWSEIGLFWKEKKWLSRFSTWLSLKVTWKTSWERVPRAKKLKAESCPWENWRHDWHCSCVCWRPPCFQFWKTTFAVENCIKCIKKGFYTSHHQTLFFLMDIEVLQKRWRSLEKYVKHTTKTEIVSKGVEKLSLEKVIH